MYYSFKCTYCGRAFYTYDRNRHQASVTLYRAVKNHLIEYNEDHKEHEMDDGEQEDSNQIYAEMTESSAPPPGGIKATVHTATPIPVGEKPKAPEIATPTTHTAAETPKLILAVVLFFMIVIMGLFIFVPSFADYISQFFVLGAR
jgi:hypothetical protein